MIFSLQSLFKPKEAKKKLELARQSHIKYCGRVYDLESLFRRLNERYFDNRIQAHVRWSARVPHHARRSILLGSYHAQKKIITLSKRLDRPDVPLFFVEYVLFHEMLHALFPREKHRMHTAKFQQYEKIFPEYERARQWEKDHIALLMKPVQEKLFS